jgi:hypothetical protein
VKAHYTGPLDVRKISAMVWALLADLTLVRANGEEVTALRGFWTDYASTPQILWSFGLPASGEYDAAAVTHDWLYLEHQIGQRAIERSEADGIFFEALRAVGVGPVKAWLMWAAVRSCGWTKWGA